MQNRPQQERKRDSIWIPETRFIDAIKAPSSCLPNLRQERVMDANECLASILFRALQAARPRGVGRGGIPHTHCGKQGSSRTRRARRQSM